MSTTQHSSTYNKGATRFPYSDSSHPACDTLSINPLEDNNSKKLTTLSLAVKPTPFQFWRPFLDDPVQNSSSDDLNEPSYLPPPVEVQNSAKSSLSLEENLANKKSKAIKPQIKCKYCNFISKRPFNVKRHIKSLHSPLKVPTSCCGIQFVTKYYAIQHKETEHTPDEKGYIYNCRQCLNSFRRLPAFKEHLIRFHPFNSLHHFY